MGPVCLPVMSDFPHDRINDVAKTAFSV